MELTLTSTPAVLKTNFTELESHLKSEVAKYDIVVTSDTIKDAKKLATELNKTKGTLDKRRKQEVANASVPIKLFDTQMKGLADICEVGRQKILVQVKKFEEETLKLAAERLESYREDLYQQLGIELEFRTALVHDLAKLGTLTGKNELTAGARRDVQLRVGECQTRMHRVHLRLSELENASHRAGLHSALTREHVAGFLDVADDAQYRDNLDNLIIREMERQEETEKVARAKLEDEEAEKIRRAAEIKVAEDVEIARIAAEKVARSTPKVAETTPEVAIIVPQVAETVPDISETAPEVATPAPMKVPPNMPEEEKDRHGVPSGKKRVTCSFVIKVAPTTPHEAINAALRKQMTAAGIQNLESVHVENIYGD